MSGRLTKKFFMSLPEGLYLVSGVGDAPGQPAFGETVSAIMEREAQWQRILNARINNRLCDVFQSSANYMKYTLAIRYRRERN